MKKISVRFSVKAAKNLLAQFSEQMMTSLFEIREFYICSEMNLTFSYSSRYTKACFPFEPLLSELKDLL